MVLYPLTASIRFQLYMLRRPQRRIDRPNSKSDKIPPETHSADHGEGESENMLLMCLFCRRLWGMSSRGGGYAGRWAEQGVVIRFIAQYVSMCSPWMAGAECVIV